jgi:hypothetical protein
MLDKARVIVRLFKFIGRALISAARPGTNLPAAATAPSHRQGLDMGGHCHWQCHGGVTAGGLGSQHSSHRRRALQVKQPITGGLVQPEQHLAGESFELTRKAASAARLQPGSHQPQPGSGSG